MSLGQAEARIGRVKVQYLCQSPGSHCGGAKSQYCSGMVKCDSKTHATPQECFRCYTRYLLSQGYTQLGKREFVKGDGPILLLDKPSKGTRLRGGKGKRYNSTSLMSGLIR